MPERFTQPVPPMPSGGIPASIADQGPRPLSIEMAGGYAGTYYSGEVDASFVLTAADRGLLLSRETDAEPAVMQPGPGPDEFRARGLTIRFERDAGGKVLSLTVDAGRVRGITFTRRP